MSVLPIGISGESEYQISRSVRLNAPDSSYFSRTPASAGNRKTWTWSGWVKRSRLGAEQYLFAAGESPWANPSTQIYFTSGDNLILFDYTTSTQINLTTSAVYRDPGAFLHIIVAVDTTQATSSNRVKIYVNGTQVTAFGTATYPSQNYDTVVNNTKQHLIGSAITASFLGGYLTEVNFIDGQALTPSSFGETDPQTGVWRPKKYTGTYGTNGFILTFEDNSGTTSTTLGKDYSGNGNNWTPNNFSVTAGAGNDSLVDVPTRWGSDTGAGGEVRGNYATMNPLEGLGTASDGNLRFATSGTSANASRANISVTSGKWYWEATCVSATNSVYMIGVSDTTIAPTAASWTSANGWAYYGNNGQKYNNSASSAYGASYTANDVIGVALDMDAGTLTFYKNGVSQGQAFSGLTGKQLAPYLGDVGQVATYTLNFGQRPFAYTAPSGFKALCTTNLPEPTIKDGGDYFNVVTYTGTAGVAGSVTGVGFQPDLVWVKSRNAATGHVLVDIVRGVQKGLFSHSTNAEVTSNEYLLSFDSDGFSYGVSNSYSQSSMVAWNWKAGGAGVTNTAGTITSTVSANTTAGFSIVTYTGTGANATVGHGLGVAPSLIIVKNRTTGTTDVWLVQHSSLGATKYIILNRTDAAGTISTAWNDTAPTSSVFSIGTLADVNRSTNNYVAYCFAEVAGFSKAFSYTGNGSTDGPFVFTNHRPAFLLVKRTDTTGNWTVLDLRREGYNVDNDPLYPNLADAEGTTDLADLLSNGFKLRSTDASVNASGGTYIYMSLATNPFKYSLAR